MATNTKIVRTSPDKVWDVLTDGWLYPLWVVGATRMRAVDADWPAVGSKLHHSVGVWPLLIDDNTEVLECEPGTLLRLRARGWPVGEAEVVHQAERLGGETLVEITEDAVSGPGTLVPEPAEGLRIKVRNVETLRRLALLAEGRGRPVTYDAVVIGAGPNGLVAANHLLDKGWCVLVLEAQPEVGGAVRSAEDVEPGFVHDTFSAFYPLAAASPGCRALHLERHGLRWVHAPAVLGHPRLDGSWALLHRDRDVTARLDRGGPPATVPRGSSCATSGTGSGSTWSAPSSPRSRLSGRGSPLLARLRSVGGLDFVKTLLTPAADLGRCALRRHRRPAAARRQRRARRHPPGLAGIRVPRPADDDARPDRRLPCPRGRRRRALEALARRIESLGGEIRCAAAVTSIDVVDGRATGVRTEHGERIGRPERWSPTSPPRTSTAGCSTSRTCRRGPRARCAASSSTRPRSRWTGL